MDKLNVHSSSKSKCASVITHRDIEDNLVCVFIDDNFMRLNEAERVKSTFSSLPLNLPIKVLNERTRFMEAFEDPSNV